MFNLLKNKLHEFISSFSKKSEEKLKLNLSLETKVKGFVSGEVEIKEKDVSELLNKFELSLLEADVAYPVAEKIVGRLKERIIGMKVKVSDAEKDVKNVIKNVILEIMSMKRPDLLSLCAHKYKEKQPFIILLLGPNGAGKTTTIAKLVWLFKKNGYSSVLALADTWRAASQEQGNYWAEKLGVKAIGGMYGADPASVGWNACAHAKSKKIDVVLIDTAGRQETNKNLLQELEKIVRVTKPDIKIYIGEIMAGNAVIEQVSTFDKTIGVDAVILTKADIDAKGGGVISISVSTGKPTIYLGTGQEVDKLIEFEPERIVNALFT